MVKKGTGIPIGIIGPANAVNRIIGIVKTFPSFSPIARYIDSDEEAPLAAEELENDVEVLFISGPNEYKMIRERTQLSVPVHSVPLSENALYHALILCKTKTAESKLSISADTLSPQVAEKALKGVEGISIICFDDAVTSSAESMLQFHKEKRESGEASLTLTGSLSVSHLLAEQGIPHGLLVPSDHDIIVSLERALLATETRQSKEAQIVVGIINVDEFGRLVQKQTSEHEVQKLKLDIHRMLLEYVKSLDGYLTPLGGDEFLFFTTRGIFEKETGGYKSIPLARYADKAFGISLRIGIGFGRSANEAGSNARNALGRAKETGGNTCFIVREDKTLIGPLAMVDPLRYDLSLTDAELMKRAEQSGMTSSYLSKLMSNAARLGTFEYTVHELASTLGITVRSTHRLLQIWMEAQLVEASGMQKLPKGRPRQLYRISFLSEFVNK